MLAEVLFKLKSYKMTQEELINLIIEEHDNSLKPEDISEDFLQQIDSIDAMLIAVSIERELRYNVDLDGIDITKATVTELLNFINEQQS